MTLNPELSPESTVGTADALATVAGTRSVRAMDEQALPFPGVTDGIERHIEEEKTDQAGRRPLGRWTEAVEYAAAT